MNSDIRIHLKANLKKKVEKKCNKNGYVDEVYKILEYGDGIMKPENLSGNVLYNICFKKLNTKLDNLLDNHLIHIVEWYQHIQQRRPGYPCTNFWQLSNQQQIENLLEIKFTKTQEDFFKQYWQKQLAYSLSIPETPMSIEQLVSVWNIDNYFNNWSIAWTIFVYELINRRFEYQRLWSIDLEKFNSWEDLAKIQTRYDSNLTPPTN
jgi:hypothetical protein